MIDWLRRLGAKKAVPLTGVPAVRRLKTYSAASGYVYQYFYTGHRPATSGTEYVFEVSGDRKTYLPVSVFLPAETLAAWQQNRRELISTEQYAVAKLALFQAFDERTDPAGMREPVHIRPSDIEQIAEQLGLE